MSASLGPCAHSVRRVRLRPAPRGEKGNHGGGQRRTDSKGAPNRNVFRCVLSKTGTYLQHDAPLLLDTEDTIEKLSAMHHVLHRAGGMTLVDLQSPP
jgi:hypothetical protein